MTSRGKFAGFFVSLGLFFGWVQAAAAAEISFDCARLDASQTEELAARVRLALRPSAAPPAALLVACDPARGWVVWNGPPLELLQIRADANMVEAVLDAIEARVAAGPLSQPVPVREAPAKTAPPTPPSPAEVPALEYQRPVIPQRSRPYDPIGGLAVGATVELPTHPLSTMIGPRLDVALGAGAFWAGFEESARFGNTAAGDSAFLYDLELMVGFGAPFVPKYPIGAVVASGIEWFFVRGPTSNTGILTVGLRGALSVDPLAIALGVDGRLRFAPPDAEAGTTGESVQMPRFAALITLSGVLRLEPLLRAE